LVARRSAAVSGLVSRAAGSRRRASPSFAAWWSTEGSIGRAFARPVGVGRDIPEWLIRLENEVQRVQVSHSAIAQLAEGLYKVSRRVLTVEQVSEQVNSLNEKNDSKES